MGRPLLIIVGGLFVVFGLVQNSMQSNIMMHSQRAIDFHSDIHAENIANAVMDYAVTNITHDRNWRDTLFISDYMDAQVTLEFQDLNQYTLQIRSFARYNGKLGMAEVEMFRRPLSYYAYFTDIEPSNIYFIGPEVLSGHPGEIVNGPLHTNGRLNFAGSPTFNGPVTSTTMWYGHPSYSNNPVFNATANFSAPREFLHEADFSELTTAAATQGISFDTEVELEFLDNGNLRVWDVATGDESEISHSDIVNSGGLIHSTSRVSVRGTVKGSYTLFSQEDIIINGDLVYEEHPDDNFDTEDMLGIVSNSNVRISEDAHLENGSQDVNVHASIVALGTSFGADNYNTGSPRGDLNLLGGIIQVQRGPVGTFGRRSTTGYAKNYSYDERFQERVPPFFPRQNFYSVKHWMTHVYPDTHQPI